MRLKSGKIENQFHIIKHGARSTRILIVEDEQIIGSDISLTLQSIGYQVAGICTSAEDALLEVARVPPDLVLMDIVLSGRMGGIDAARKISTDHKVPVVFLTARSDDATVEHAMQAEPYGYLLKPFHTAELRSTLEMALTRHRAEMRASDQGKRATEAFRSMSDGVIATDLTGTVTFLNPAAEKMTGWPTEDAVGNSLSDVFQITGSEQTEEQSTKPGSGPVMLRTRSGESVPVEDNTSPIKDENGSLSGLLVLFRLRPENLPHGAPPPATNGLGLVTSDQPAQHAGLIESIGDPLIAIDSAGNISFVNGQAATFLGRSREDLVGHPFSDAFPSSLHRRCSEEFHHVLKDGETREFELHDEQSERWLGVSSYPFDGGALAILRDITEKKRSAEQDRRIEKLESLGLLARGFAHNFNNLLTVLLGNLSLAEMDSTDPGEIKSAIGNAKRASLEAQGLVQQLLVFAKGGAPIRRHVDLESLLGEIYDSLTGKPSVNYSLDLSSSIPAIEADPNQLCRLLLNLIHNAEDAMPGGGDLTVRAGIEQLPEADESDTASNHKGEPRMLIEITDTGEGMDEATRRRAFEPYFSTRDSANASGIGLTVCRSIVAAHGGDISIFSTPDGGTTIRVALPIGNPPEECQNGIVPEKSHPLPGPEVTPRILVLEDEKMIRQLIVSNLQKQGYEVDATEDGAETVKAYRKSFDENLPYDLVIMDLSIPNGVGGATAMEQIRVIDPAVRAIVSSGYSDDPVMANHQDYGFSAVLPKPYRPIELADLVNKMLGRSVTS